LTAISIYEDGGPVMTKTLVDIDDGLLAKASKALGTTTKKDTVNAALQRVVRVAAMEQHIESARNGLYSDLLDPEVMKGAWR
jgi:Arc/MetJ family transcription regulator